MLDKSFALSIIWTLNKFSYSFSFILKHSTIFVSFSFVLIISTSIAIVLVFLDSSKSLKRSTWSNPIRLICNKCVFVWSFHWPTFLSSTMECAEFVIMSNKFKMSMMSRSCKNTMSQNIKCKLPHIQILREECYFKTLTRRVSQFQNNKFQLEFFKITDACKWVATSRMQL